jgi:cytochrome c
MKGQKGTWSPEDLDHFLLNPKAAVPGTNMSFAGIPRGKERADLITFLNSHSDKPVDLPKQAAEAPKAQ